jgi:hypothetical protein
MNSDQKLEFQIPKNEFLSEIFLHQDKIYEVGTCRFDLNFFMKNRKKIIHFTDVIAFHVSYLS